jgi:ribonuclease HII
MKIAGIDEAGKGAVIGTMCIAGVKIDIDAIHSLKNLGIKNSKKNTQEKARTIGTTNKKTLRLVFYS